MVEGSCRSGRDDAEPIGRFDHLADVPRVVLAGSEVGCREEPAKPAPHSRHLGRLGVRAGKQLETAQAFEDELAGGSGIAVNPEARQPSDCLAEDVGGCADDRPGLG